ncbi:hypothetical protein GCM10009541_59370 [Micromonospora gifhornensis]|uniref:Roadblock/LAMTOR2 domain-containing protein n=1 Tax=Micromonospora gifhornensis TaxID=84594 RepID=A0ABQ4IMA1_9ACTN|nr:roadblock/LC7 domain-containing protein [Micromonospora gifhornensis]GIJ19043.1 hypothetical protein Vgi01_57270 [Micromonospora gifhornensis]
MSDNNLSFLLNNNVRVVAGVSHAVAVSVDGLLLAWTEGLNRDAAERLAAVAAGLNSLLNGAARDFDAGAVRGNITDTDRGYLILTSLSRGGVAARPGSPGCGPRVRHRGTGALRRAGG